MHQSGGGPAVERATGGVEALAHLGGVHPAGEPLTGVFDAEEASAAGGGVLAVHEVGQLGGGHGFVVALARMLDVDAEIVDEPLVVLIEDIDEARRAVVLQMEFAHDVLQLFCCHNLFFLMVCGCKGTTSRTAVDCVPGWVGKASLLGWARGGLAWQG